MGYTHNWYRSQVISPSTFNAITEDFQQVLPALEKAGSPIANAYCLEEPEFTAGSIRFNGVRLEVIFVVDAEAHQTTGRLLKSLQSSS